MNFNRCIWLRGIIISGRADRSRLCWDSKSAESWNVVQSFPDDDGKVNMRGSL